MVELQSCASLVNASALCAIEQEVMGESVNVVAEISAELQRERQRNAELMERISILEAQIRERNKETPVTDEQHAVARSFKKFKRQQVETTADEIEKRNTVQSKMGSQHKPDSESLVPKEKNTANRLVTWMSMDDSQNLYLEKFKDSDSLVDFDETDSDDECDDNYDDDDIENGHRHRESDDGNTETANVLQDGLPDHIVEESQTQCVENFAGCQSIPAANERQEVNENHKKSCILPTALPKKNEVKTPEGKEIQKTGGFMLPPETPSLGSVSISQHRKPLKVAFCPKEIRRIIESEALQQKDAQSHTIRKIVVFASLGIRHGCEDMYELDFNHFSILKKGEPYVSPRNPGEHVLYENPGLRRKIFYPNRQNPVLCPVQILEEEKAMRPSDVSCPSCLFLCIKYGGRTRNLPQNEYVRQRMGRNKLKSFGPLMCRMAMLVHIRSGSFFFKALGITLLFMAGFPDDLVQRETKHRNLGLLQKYYRTDEDAEGEELFLPHPITCDDGTPEPQNFTGKSLPARSRGRKHSNSISKSHNLQKTSLRQPTPSSLAAAQSTSSGAAPTQFGLTGYSSSQTYAIATYHSIPSQISHDTSRMSNPVLAPSSANISGNHTSYRMLPPQPTSPFVPIMYWPPLNAFPSRPYGSTYGYGYHLFPSTPNYMSFHTQPYYNHPSCSSSLAKFLEGYGKNDVTSNETDSDSNRSSGSKGQKQKSAICK